ncbi:MAG: ribosome maturation factor RimM [Piscirickettsiaceae bacterium]|nr:ribosome maturation factor RimM [Piscirickettsiaceae bacterium]
MANSDEFIRVGKIAGAFGVKGWVKIFSFTDPRKNILSYSPLYLLRKGEWVKLDVVSGRVQGKGIVMSLQGITDPDQVLPLVGTELAIKKEQLKPTTNNEFYWSQLIGLTVINLKDETLGIVDSLHETGANDVLVVKNKEQKTEQLVPFVMEEVVQLVDLDNKIIRVDWELDY